MSNQLERMPIDTALEQVVFDPELLRETYGEIPITFLRTFSPGTRWPKKLRMVFTAIWTGRAGTNIIIKSCRGGGKSQLLGSIGFCFFFFKDRSVVDMAGSLAQAKIVYNYFTSILEADHRVVDSLPKEPMMEHTTGINNNYFTCVAASPKAVRGPHPDVLMGDEVCETPDELVESALPMVDVSKHPLRILTSTFHKVFGIFQDIWDRADELGYTRFSWDIFDVAESFDEAIWDDPKLVREIPDLAKLKELSKGRTGDPEGWVPIHNIINAWRGKRSLDWFLTEYMGERPSAAGLVIDPVDVDRAIFEPSEKPEYNFVKGAEVVGGLDWGFSSMTAFVSLMNGRDDTKIELDNENYIQTESKIIIEDIVKIVKKRGIKIIYADSAGKFENIALQQALTQDPETRDCVVIEVVFSKDKDEMLGNYRAHFERGKMKIPKNHQTAIWQHKRYRYMPGTDRPAKKDDHVPDATMCALKHWPLGRIVGDITDLRSTKGKAKPITSGLRRKQF